MVIYDEKWILYNNWQWPSQWLDQEESLKYFLKPNLHQKMVMVTVSWSAVSLIHCSFLNPGKTITPGKYAQQINEMHQQLQCLQLVLGNRMGPIVIHDQHLNTMSHSQHLKSWTNWTTKFCLIHHIHLNSHQPTTIFSRISTTFYRENTSTTSRRQKIISKSSSNPEAWIFTLQE